MEPPLEDPPGAPSLRPPIPLTARDLRATRFRPTGMMDMSRQRPSFAIAASSNVGTGSPRASQPTSRRRLPASTKKETARGRPVLFVRPPSPFLRDATLSARLATRG